jgi:DNA-binding SARP family transcriptional activator/predicted ATPase
MFRTNILLLGPPRVERAGAPVEADTRKATALLAYLAVAGGPVRRDTLADLLWPEYGQKKARASLRRTLSALASARSEGWLLVGREDVSLAEGETFVDAERFRSLLEERKHHGHPDAGICPECVGPLSEAVALYRGDFMEGFGLRDSAVFDDWQFFQSEELRRDLSSALEKLARAEAVRPDFDAAIHHARRRLNLDRLNESSHRLLMQLYALSGARNAALRQYGECVRTLERELGVAPLEETTRLHAAIKTNDLPPAPALSEYLPESIPEPPRGDDDGEARSARKEEREKPMAGREAEWAAMLGAYANAESPGGRVVSLEGEAGIGKTRLAEEFLRHAAGRGASTVSVRCYPDEAGLAYGPFAEALSEIGEKYRGKLAGVAEHHIGEAARLSPSLAGMLEAPVSPATPDSPGAQSRFFEGVGQTMIAALDGSPPGVFLVDDAHFADEASLDLLSYLVRRLGNSRVCVVISWREDGAPEGHRLRDLLTHAGRAGVSSAVSLSRLDRESVESLVANVAGGASGLGERLYEETEGLPLLLAEYLAEIEAGEIAASDEEWPLPGGARDLLRGRLSSIGEGGRRALSAAAVIGHSFDLDTLRESSGLDEEEVVLALEDLASRRLVGEAREAGERTAAYDFAHEKLRSLVYEETSLARRRLLHRRVAESLARRPRARSGAEAARVARHFALAGLDAEAAEYFKLAGEAHLALYANAEALSHFRSALELGHPDGAEIRESIGDILTLVGDYAGAARSFESAAELRERGEDLARIERKLGGLHHRLGEWSLAEEHYEAALGVLGDHPGDGEKARLRSEMSLLSLGRGRLREAAEYSRIALDLAEKAKEPLALARVHNVAAMVHRSLGDPARAKADLERSLELSEALEDPAIKVAALNNLALVHGESGETERAAGYLRQALELCVALGDRHHEAALRNNLADLLHKTGREEESRKALEEAVKIFAEIGGEREWRPEIWKLVEW